MPEIDEKGESVNALDLVEENVEYIDESKFDSRVNRSEYFHHESTNS